MQTDPVFAERAGFDSYDPYSYVHSNPVNFTDPTGAISLKLGSLGDKVIEETEKAIQQAYNQIAKAIKNTLVATVKAAILIPTGFIAAAVLGIVTLDPLGSIGYVYGGLHGTNFTDETHFVDWNEERARSYRDFVKEAGYPVAIGAVVGSVLGGATGNPGWAATGAKIGATIGAQLGGSREAASEWPPQDRRNMASKGKFSASWFLSEYDYNGDGQVDMNEYGIAWNTGARKNQMDLNRSGKISLGEATLYLFETTKDHNSKINWDYLMMYGYANEAKWINE